MRVTRVLTLSLPPKMAKQVDSLAAEEQMTRSEFLREAVRQYIRNVEWARIRLYGAKRAAELGIKDEKDVQRLVDEYRGERR